MFFRVDGGVVEVGGSEEQKHKSLFLLTTYVHMGPHSMHPCITLYGNTLTQLFAITGDDTLPGPIM